MTELFALGEGVCCRLEVAPVQAHLAELVKGSSGVADVPRPELLADRGQLQLSLRPLAADPEHLRSVHPAVARILCDPADGTSTDLVGPLPGPVEITR